MKSNKSLNTIKKILYVNFAAGALFSLMCISFSFDISILAFILAVGFSALLGYYTFVKVLKEEDGSKIFITRKLSEYYPCVLFIAFILRRAGKKGTFYWYDLITVILWLTVFVLSLILSSKLNEKNGMEFAKDFKIKPSATKKRIGMAKLGWEAGGWVDALVQAIFEVMIFQIFFFQLYEIPSESMVPTFLIKDRVIVSKIECGPKFPLTEVGLPDFRTYKRGDTIVLRNPHYTIDRKSEVKSVTTQLIYMLSLMTINLNRDEHGQLKADPLVKRIVGIPGEQLVMQDGTLYSRTKDHDFVPVELDKKYANWNCNTLNSKIKSKVRMIPLDSQEYQEMLDFEEQRRAFNLTAAEFQANELVRKFNKLAYTEELIGKFEQSNLTEYTLFSDLQNMTRKLMSQEGGAEWFANFMTSWIPAADESRDVYAEANFKMNVMSKITMGNIIVRYAELFRDNVSASLWGSDVTLSSNYETLENLNWYMQEIMDQRNMPLFPANDSNGNAQYIPNNCYFMMGDNRFNSLDLRHSMTQKPVALAASDPLSVEYYSNMAPQYINKKYIVGKPSYRYWPAGRLGSCK